MLDLYSMHFEVFRSKLASQPAKQKLRQPNHPQSQLDSLAGNHLTKWLVSNADSG